MKAITREVEKLLNDVEIRNAIRKAVETNTDQILSDGRIIKISTSNKKL